MDLFEAITLAIVISSGIIGILINVIKWPPPKCPYKKKLEDNGFTVSYEGDSEYVEGLTYYDDTEMVIEHPYKWVIKNQNDRVVATIYLPSSKNEKRMIFNIAEDCEEKDRDTLLDIQESIRKK